MAEHAFISHQDHSSMCVCESKNPPSTREFNQQTTVILVECNSGFIYLYVFSYSNYDLIRISGICGVCFLLIKNTGGNTI